MAAPVDEKPKEKELTSELKKTQVKKILKSHT
jgi:hypothetical protein